MVSSRHPAVRPPSPAPDSSPPAGADPARRSASAADDVRRRSTCTTPIGCSAAAARSGPRGRSSSSSARPARPSSRCTTFPARPATIATPAGSPPTGSVATLADAVVVASAARARATCGPAASPAQSTSSRCRGSRWRRRGDRGPRPRPPVVGVLGFIFPGKGHVDVVDGRWQHCATTSPCGLGAVSDGHDELLGELVERFAVRARRALVVTGFLDAELAAAVRRGRRARSSPHHGVGVGVAGSRGSARGRRPLAGRQRVHRRAGRCAPELGACSTTAERWPGQLAAAISPPSTTRVDRADGRRSPSALARASGRRGAPLGLPAASPRSTWLIDVDRGLGIRPSVGRPASGAGQPLGPRRRRRRGGRTGAAVTVAVVIPYFEQPPIRCAGCTPPSSTAGSDSAPRGGRRRRRFAQSATAARHLAAVCRVTRASARPIWAAGPVPPATSAPARRMPTCSCSSTPTPCPPLDVAPARRLARPCSPTPWSSAGAATPTSAAGRRTTSSHWVGGRGPVRRRGCPDRPGWSDGYATPRPPRRRRAALPLRDLGGDGCRRGLFDDIGGFDGERSASTAATTGSSRPGRSTTAPCSSTTRRRSRGTTSRTGPSVTATRPPATAKRSVSPTVSRIRPGGLPGSSTDGRRRSWSSPAPTRARDHRRRAVRPRRAR